MSSDQGQGHHRQRCHYSPHYKPKDIKCKDKCKDINQKLLRWSLILQQYNFTIVHKSGYEHKNADALSRL